MTISFAGVFADAGAIWRSERQLVMRVAGVFYVLPVLAFVLLLASSGFPPNVPADQMKEALDRFQTANLVPILLISVVLDFGTFAILNLFLQGGGRTLGEVLVLTLRRFLPFLVLDLAAGFVFGLGMSLLVLPGLFVFARTWLAAPAFAAHPELGVIEAFRQGWRRSGGLNWLQRQGQKIILQPARVPAACPPVWLEQTLLRRSDFQQIWWQRSDNLQPKPWPQRADADAIWANMSVIRVEARGGLTLRLEHRLAGPLLTLQN